MTASHPRCEVKHGRAPRRSFTCQELWPYLKGSWCPTCAAAGAKNLATR